MLVRGRLCAHPAVHSPFGGFPRRSRSRGGLSSDTVYSALCKCAHTGLHLTLCRQCMVNLSHSRGPMYLHYEDNVKCLRHQTCRLKLLEGLSTTTTLYITYTFTPRYCTILGCFHSVAARPVRSSIVPVNYACHPQGDNYIWTTLFSYLIIQIDGSSGKKTNY